MIGESEAGRRPVGIAAFFLSLVIVLLGARWYQDQALNRAGEHLQSTATTGAPVTWGALTFQRAALRDPHALVVFGSSESLCICGLPYLAGYYYRFGPTGFTVYAVGTGAMSDLVFAQTLGALGDSLAGKKMILSVPWERFQNPKGVTPAAYDNLYRPEIADGFIFDAPLPLSLKAAVARRMLAYPETMADDPVLRTASEALARGSFADLIVYGALYPVGRIQSYVRQVQDAWQTDTYLDQHSWYHTNEPLQGTTPNWQQLLADGTQRALGQVSNNPFGWWYQYEDQEGASLTNVQAVARYCATVGDPVPPAPADDASSTLLQSPEWEDLSLAMQTTHSLQADALALTYPFPGYWLDFTRLTPPWERAAFVATFEAAGARTGVPTLALPEFDHDRLFLAEPLSHLSPRGAVLIDRAYDMFWQGQPPSEIKPALDQLAEAVPTSPLPPPSPWYCQ